MFYLIQREDEVALPPRSFTSDIEQKILHELRRKVEGKCTGRFGYTVLVRRLEAFGNALLNEDSGWAHFPVKYLALVFRPHKNEVLLAEVVALNETGLFAQAGPLTIYVSRYSMAPDAFYDTYSNPPCFVSEQHSYRIKKDTTIAVKITGIRLAANEISVVGSINEDFLGPVED